MAVPVALEISRSLANAAITKAQFTSIARIVDEANNKIILSEALGCGDRSALHDYQAYLVE